MEASERCSVLVVEDDPSIAQFVQAVLSDEGYEAGIAHNGREALETVERAKPALILLDLLLPVMDGVAFLRDLRRRYGTEIPVILMTATRDESHPGGMSVEGVLLKPFDLPQLLGEVERVLEDRCPA